MKRWLALGWMIAVACSTTPAPVAATQSADGVQVRIVRLAHAQAEELAEVLVEVLGPRCPGPGAGDLKVTAKAGENAVVVCGPPERLREAMDLIARLDCPVPR